MAELLFIYEGEKIIIHCNNLENKMKDIINKFENKIKKEESNNLYYIYNGDKLNEELKLNQIIKDKNLKKINIFVYNNKNKDNKKEIISSEIICPECKENILININNYKINLYECKNGHKKENILLNEFENIQKIDKTYAINVIKIIIILMKNFIYVMNVILIYVHYVNINMIKIIILLIIMIRIIYVKSIMINI